MNVWALRLFRSVVPLPFILLTLISITFLLVSGLRRNHFLDKNYLFMVDASRIQAYKTSGQQVATVQANSIGLSNYYYFYLWGHCSSNRKLKGLKCTDPRIDYYFDPRGILRKELYSGIVVRLPSGTQSFTKKVRIASLCMITLYLIGALFGLLTFLSVIIVTASGTGLIYASLLAAYTWFAFVAGSGTMTVMYYVVKNSIRDKAGYLNVKSSYGKDALLVTWSVSALSLVVFVSLLIATGLNEKRKREAAKLYQ